MAIFTAENGFDATAINLHGLFVGTPTILNRAGSSVTVPAVSESLLGVDVDIPALSYSFAAGSRATFSNGTIVTVLGQGVTLDSMGYVASGQVTGFGITSGGVTEAAMLGISVAAADLRSAEISVSTVDDRALLLSALRGNDLVMLTVENDNFLAGAGKDLILNKGGMDTLSAGAGDDVVIGGVGADSVNGGTGNDLIVGMASADTLLGSIGHDIIAGGRGMDLLRGGAGADYFVFSAGDGRDVIGDFDVNLDKIVIAEGFDFADVTIARAGAAVLVTFGDVAIRLVNRAVADVTEADFRFDGLSDVADGLNGFLDGWTYLP